MFQYFLFLFIALKNRYCQPPCLTVCPEHVPDTCPMPWLLIYTKIHLEFHWNHKSNWNLGQFLVRMVFSVQSSMNSNREIWIPVWIPPGSHWNLGQFPLNRNSFEIPIGFFYKGLKAVFHCAERNFSLSFLIVPPKKSQDKEKFVLHAENFA
jgi:hypothetical protein